MHTEAKDETTETPTATTAETLKETDVAAQMMIYEK